MRRVGYIAGISLEDLEGQWASFIDAEVDVILIDRTFLKSGFNMADSTQSNPEKEPMWQYAEAMRAAQDMSGNYDRYIEPKDLIPGDNLVLTDLSTLHHAKPGLWEEMMDMNRKGVGIEVLNHNFISTGSYGDDVLEMMDDLYKLGRTLRKEDADI
jgi:hypothetical protein